MLIAAVVLAAEAADADSVPQALDRYDQARRPRSQQVQRMARTDPRLSLSTSGATYRLMTATTRLASAGVARSKSARLWDWTPPVLTEVTR